MRILSGFAYLYMCIKVPLTGGLLKLGAGKPVARKIVGGGSAFEKRAGGSPQMGCLG